MGVGKTTVCKCLKDKLPNAVFLDGDWCWDANPFQVTDETKEMVIDNICYLRNNYIHCSVYDNIIFCWVMHERIIIDTIINKINTQNCSVKRISLFASNETLTERIMKEVKAGIRTIDVLKRSIAKIPFYENINSVKIDTDTKTVSEIAEEIMRGK